MNKLNIPRAFRININANAFHRNHVVADFRKSYFVDFQAWRIDIAYIGSLDNLGVDDGQARGVFAVQLQFHRKLYPAFKLGSENLRLVALNCLHLRGKINFYLAIAGEGVAGNAAAGLELIRNVEKKMFDLV